MKAFLHGRRVRKVLLMMKLTTILFLAGLMQVSATVYSQATKFSFKAEKKQIVDLLKDIEETSNFRFFYIREQVNVERQVSVKAEDATVEEILDEIFSGEGISYKVLEDNLILLSPEKKTVESSSGSVMQQNLISGVVTDETRQPLPGVTVVVKGTSRGTITDGLGKYSLPNISKENILIFSFVGMVAQEIQAGTKTQINVTLKAETIGLEEVVAIGYGVQKKSNVTGSIVSVKSSDIENRTVTDAMQALQGKAAGVQIVNQSGAPGSTANIQIRGYSSNSRTTPLTIVDGLKVPNLNYLDPDNIASIEILKDGASAAIYGVEAGNGVILVTTKTGSSAVGQGRIFYNLQRSSEQIANMPKLLNAEQYMDYMLATKTVTRKEDFFYDGVSNTDWVDRVTETGNTTRHTVGMEGANERGKFYTSLASTNSDGIIVGNKDVYKRLTAQINADYKVKNWLSVGITTSIENTESQNVSEGAGGVLGSALNYDPITPWTYTKGQEPARLLALVAQGLPLPKDKDGNYFGDKVFMGGSWNPGVILQRTDATTKSFNTRGTAYLNLTPIKGLTITSRFGYRAGYSQNNTYNYSVYSNTYMIQSMSINGRSSNNLYYQWENFGTYLFKIGEHNFNAMAGMSYQNTESNFVYANADKLSSDNPNFRYLSNALNSSTMSVSGIPDERTNMSYYGRFGWTYKNKYDLQASFRADAYDTSKLDKDHRWGYFPSISGGWTISNEEFMSNIKSKLGMSSLRLRASYGVNGNVNALGDYQYSTTLASSVGQGYDFGNGSGQLVGIYPSTQLPNPLVKWETTRQANVGFGARFLNDRLTMEFDAYNKNTFDLLTSSIPPANTGASTVFKNVGTVNNRGLELELGWKDKIGKLGYSINGNIAYLKNKVTKGVSKERVNGAALVNTDYITYFEEGYPIWYLRTYVFDKINPTTGAAIYKDLTGPGGVPNGVVNADDRQMTGKGIPDYTYGITLSLDYKNFDFTLYGTGVQGIQKLFALNRGDFKHNNTLLEFYDNMWSPTNPNGKLPILYQDDQFFKISDLMVFDASFFKIKQIQLGYNVPGKIIKKVGLSRLRAYVSFDDWFTFTKYPGLDPETSGNNINSIALDTGSYPISKKVVFGVNVSF